MKSNRHFGRIAGRLTLSVFVAAILCCMVAGPSFGDAEDAPYYAPKNKIDLGGKSVQFVFTDRRTEHTRLECADAERATGTEFDDKDGFDFFKNYVTRMAKESSAKVDAPSDNVIQIELEVLSPRIWGFVFRRVHGLAQFTVKSKALNKRYCADMKDGDPDSPLGLTSVSWTRSGAMRTMVSGSTSKTVEALLTDLSKALAEQSPAGEPQKPEAKAPTQPAQ